MTARKTKTGLTPISMENRAGEFAWYQHEVRFISIRSRSIRPLEPRYRKPTVCRRITGRTQRSYGSSHCRTAYAHDPPISLRVTTTVAGRTASCARSIADGRCRASRQAHRKSRRAHDGPHSPYASGDVRSVILYRSLVAGVSQMETFKRPRETTRTQEYRRT